MNIISFLKSRVIHQKNFRLNLGDVIAFLISFSFFILLSYYLYLLYINFNFTVFDLGINYHTLFMFLYEKQLLNNPNNILLITPSTFGKLIYVPLSLIVLIYDSPISLLITQSLMISVAGFTLFKIIFLKTGSVYAAIGVEVIFMLYPGTYGVLPNGGNFVTFLEPFLLLSYYFYIRGKTIPSFFFGIFAAISTPLGPFILIALYLLEYVIQKWRYLLAKAHILKINMEKEKNKWRPAPNYAFFILIVLSSLVILSIILFNTKVSQLIPNPLSSTVPTSSPKSFANINSYYLYLNKIISDAPSLFSFFNDSMSPTLYLSFLSPYGILIFIYFIFVGVSNFGPYFLIQILT